jgi:hypothetical protein
LLAAAPDGVALADHLEPSKLPCGLARKLHHHEMHGLLGVDANLDDCMRVGRSLFADGQYDSAAVIFQVAVRHNPDSAAARFALGQALFARGDYRRGAAIIREGLELDPEWAKIDYSVYGLFDFPRDLDHQVRFVKDYLRDRADDRDALFVLGFMQYHLTRNDEARASFDRLQGMDPDDKLVKVYKRLLGEKAKMKAGRHPYGRKGAPRGKKRFAAVPAKALEKADAHADVPPPKVSLPPSPEPSEDSLTESSQSGPAGPPVGEAPPVPPPPMKAGGELPPMPPGPPMPDAGPPPPEGALPSPEAPPMPDAPPSPEQ